MVGLSNAFHFGVIGVGKSGGKIDAISPSLVTSGWVMRF